MSRVVAGIIALIMIGMGLYLVWEWYVTDDLRYGVGVFMFSFMAWLAVATALGK
jgi:hypothetical protein